jgi:hypothetical protein
MVLRALGSQSHEYIFKVFELGEHSECVLPLHVHRSDDIGRPCLVLGYKMHQGSACASSKWRSGGVERNHIYYNHVILVSEYEPILEDMQLTWDSVDA